MSKVFIYTIDPTSFDVMLEYAKEHDYNLDVTTFMAPRYLEQNLHGILNDYHRKLRGFKGAISMHGAVEDLFIHSRDEWVREVAKRRIYQSLEIAKGLKAKQVVFHGNFNPLKGSPLVRTETYHEEWLQRTPAFWSEALEKYPVTCLIENGGDPAPEKLMTLLDKVNSPRLKICLDIGHAHTGSKVPLEEWIAVLGKDIAYIHVHDNNGDTDTHSVPGEGTINWREFSGLIAKYQIDPDIEFEVFTLGATVQSDRYFQENNIYPFNTSVSGSV